MTLQQVDLEYIILSLKDDAVSYKNIVAIDNNTAIMGSNERTDSIQLSESPSTFNSNNIYISLLKFDDQIHPFSGYYRGEINVLKIENDSVQVFEHSFSAVGWTDFEGQFTCFNSSSPLAQVNFINGRINSQGLFSGSFLNEENLSSTLSNNTSFSTPNDSLKGSLSFIQDTIEKVLEFQLKKTN